MYPESYLEDIFGKNIEKSNLFLIKKTDVVSAARKAGRQSSNRPVRYLAVPSIESPRWVLRDNRQIYLDHGNIIKPSRFISKVVWFFFRCMGILRLTSLLPSRLSVAPDASSMITRIEKKYGEVEIVYFGATGNCQKLTFKIRSDDGSTRYLKVSNKNGGITSLKNEIRSSEILASGLYENVRISTAVDSFECGSYFGFSSEDVVLESDFVLDFLYQDSSFFSKLYLNYGVELISDVVPLLERSVFSGDYDRNRFSEIPIYKSYSHGDYTPWNRFVEGGDLAIIDWESAGSRFLFYDIVYFHLSVSLRLNKKRCKASLISDMEQSICNVGISPNIKCDAVGIRAHIELSAIEYVNHYINTGEEQEIESVSLFVDELIKCLRK